MKPGIDFTHGLGLNLEVVRLTEVMDKTVNGGTAIDRCQRASVVLHGGYPRFVLSTVVGSVVIGHKLDRDSAVAESSLVVWRDTGRVGGDQGAKNSAADLNATARRYIGGQQSLARRVGDHEHIDTVGETGCG